MKSNNHAFQKVLSVYLIRQYPQRIKRDPFAGLIALLNRPRTGDGTAQPASLIVLATEQQFEQWHKPRVVGVAMGSQRL